jgi:hypothetical protein
MQGLPLTLEHAKTVENELSTTESDKMIDEEVVAKATSNNS